MEQVPEAFFRVHEGVCDKTLNHNLVNISFVKIDELDLLESVWITLSEYMWVAICSFASQKKVTASKHKLVNLHFFHMRSAHAKGLNTCRTGADTLVLQSVQTEPETGE